MHVNFQKTVILIRLAGSRRKSVLKKHTMRQNGQTFLCVPHNGSILRLPIVHDHVYLGTKISCYNFEDATLSYRLHISRITFLRLRRLLTGRKALPLPLRVRLWVACIRSSSLRGIEAAGLTPARVKFSIDASLKTFDRLPGDKPRNHDGTNSFFLNDLRTP